MKNKITFNPVILFLCLAMFLASCQAEDHEDQDYMALLKTTNPTPTNVTAKSHTVSAEDIKKEVEKSDAIYDVAVIQGDKENLVVYKVKHLQRFRMKKIEKEVNTMLEKKFPDENFIVSSDYKIFLEAVKLGEKMNKDPNFTKEKAQKRLEEIIELKKEMA